MRMVLSGKIIALLGMLFLLAVYPMMGEAGDNDACFGSECHSDAGTYYTINLTKYASNTHGLLECTECHNESVDPDDIEHGVFLRILNGTNLSAPLNFTQYNSSNYQLCYYCHNETRLIGLPAGYSDNLWSHRPSPGYPLSSDSRGTNFVNELASGYNFDNYPANIHWDHLDMHGINNNQMWDSDRDGTLDSMTSCTACHDPHGNTSGPALTRNDLGVVYGTDANGAYGIISTLEYLNPGGDVYCYGCHGFNSNFKYYRSPMNFVSNCTTCHEEAGGVVPELYTINVEVFNSSMPATIIDNSSIDAVCYTCHNTTGDTHPRLSLVRYCDDCHVGIPAFDAPPVGRHIPDPQTLSQGSASPIDTSLVQCWDCHLNSVNTTGAARTNISQVAHYGTNTSLVESYSTSDDPANNKCGNCHANTTNLINYGGAPQVSMADEIGCFQCHNGTWVEELVGGIDLLIFYPAPVNQLHVETLGSYWACSSCH